MELTMKIPDFGFKVGDFVKRNNEILYIVEIMFTMTDFDWLVVAHIVDENEIIQKTVTIPFKIWGESTFIKR